MARKSKGIVIPSMCNLFLLLSCASFDKKDSDGLLVEDYTKAIENRGITPTEPEWKRDRKPEIKYELHELYFRRGKLYDDQVKISGDAASLAYADFNRAIELAGKKAPAEYYIYRAYAGSYRAMGEGHRISIDRYGTSLHVRDLPRNPRSLSDVIADFSQAITMTSDPFRLVDMYACRGQLYFFQGDYIRAIDDFTVAERVLSTRRNSIQDNYEVWSALEYTYDKLIPQAQSNNNPQYSTFIAQRKQVSDKVSYWRNLSIDEYNRLEALRVENETKRRSEKAAECMEKAKLAKAHAKTCGHCKGSGTVLNYSAGTGNYQSSASIENGKMKWMEQKGQDSGWGPSVCPICYGKGVVLPRIEGCDPRYLN